MNALPRSRQHTRSPHLRLIRGASAAVAGGGAEVVPLFPGVDASSEAAGAWGSGGDEPLVARRDLFERLARAGRVTIVSAPAGSGKTWLVRSWVADAGLAGRTAWATVAHEERDGQRFWASVVDALDGVAAGDRGRARGEPRGEALIERLLRTMQRIDEPAVLVIDDLHELQAADALAALERFLVDPPAHLRVVLLSRGTPRLRLHRLRLAGTLTELRCSDLRFSLPATHELLKVSGSALSDAATAALHERTQGWAAGLRLATIGLAGHPDPDRYAAEFCGAERTVAGFLHAEVFDRQPPEVRDLLLRTAVLDGVNGPLADALTGRTGSLRILHDLEEANAFVTAIDVGRSWFRYHRLFADFLRLELRRLDPAVVGSLHRAAAHWFERHGDAVEAIRHAQAAGDWAYASRVLADHQLGMTLDGRGDEVRALLTAFPPHAADTDAELALTGATAFYADGLYEETAANLASAGRLAATVPADRRAAFDLTLAGMSLRLASARGDVAAVPVAARAVEAALKAQFPSGLRRAQTHRAAALVNLGVAELWSLDLAHAREHLEQALDLARRIARPSIEIACLSFLALIGGLEGRPASVGRPLVEQAAAVAETCTDGTLPSPPAAYAVGGSTFVWLGRLIEAEQWLERALAGERSPGVELLVKHATALLRLGQGRVDDALTALREAQRLQTHLVTAHPYALEVRGRMLRAQVQLGETAGVRAALEELSDDARERAEIRIAAAALELAEDRAEQALAVLGPVLDGSAPALCAPAAAIEGLLFAAASHWDLGDVRAAEASLERALSLAEPEGMLLPFALAPVRELLERHGGHRTAHATLLSKILDLLAGAAPRPEVVPLLESLSDAELRVVRYLPGNLRGPEIAAELCVSPNTIRTHLRHIYAKLDAHSRTQAVARARQLGLLAPA
ncbi:LuxR C-terminal-related transcriptional regulator [Solirubrobacter ginsenosidimutans]|uniref:LuxR C-terminal-related transcriptional regulator n=1 Tax=Solirubrobacter ginsenosidimutans TaxID=490573 RepID=A0A9X3MWM8_9ACTN|nr:LuxR C-terminal-related transcriptional regulator [Solirubrobacter ginsenosidimutans]MDA0162620.1 LuxR C-terminal-related transcriptional regulator [Solirubrobacter ginsenosidimutans]